MAQKAGGSSPLAHPFLLASACVGGSFSVLLSLGSYRIRDVGWHFSDATYWRKSTSIVLANGSERPARLRPRVVTSTWPCP